MADFLAQNPYLMTVTTSPTSASSPQRPRVGLDFTGTRDTFTYNGRLDFTGSFLDSTGVTSVGLLHEIK